MQWGGGHACAPEQGPGVREVARSHGPVGLPRGSIHRGLRGLTVVSAMETERKALRGGKEPSGPSR